MLKDFYDFVLYVSLCRRRCDTKAARAEQSLVDGAGYDMTNIPCERDSAGQSEGIAIYPACRGTTATPPRCQRRLPLTVACFWLQPLSD